MENYIKKDDVEIINFEIIKVHECDENNNITPKVKYKIHEFVDYDKIMKEDKNND